MDMCFRFSVTDDVTPREIGRELHRVLYTLDGFGWSVTSDLSPEDADDTMEVVKDFIRKEDSDSRALYDLNRELQDFISTQGIDVPTELIHRLSRLDTHVSRVCQSVATE